MRNIHKGVLRALTLLIVVAGAAVSVSVAKTLAPETPLAERLSDAETVFVGVVTNKVLDGRCSCWIRIITLNQLLQ